MCQTFWFANKTWKSTKHRTPDDIQLHLSRRQPGHQKFWSGLIRHGYHLWMRRSIPQENLLFFCAWKYGMSILLNFDSPVPLISARLDLDIQDRMRCVLWNNNPKELSKFRVSNAVRCESGYQGICVDDIALAPPSSNKPFPMTCECPSSGVLFLPVSSAECESPEYKEIRKFIRSEYQLQEV